MPDHRSAATDDGPVMLAYGRRHNVTDRPLP